MSDYRKSGSGDRYELSGKLMFDTRRTGAPGDSRYVDKPTSGGLTPAQLDSSQAQALCDRLLGHYLRELDRQTPNRIEMAVDEDFYDHIHFTEEELEVLSARGQLPVTYNLTATTVNWLLGSQRRATQDYRVLPRTKDGAATAERKTQLLHHVRDENRSEFEWAAAFAHAVKAGIGWMECGQGNPEDGVTVFDRHENWRNMLWDSTAARYDLQDARYQFRTKWLDVDVAAALFPKRVGTILAAAAETSNGIYALDDLGDEPMDSVEQEHFWAASSSNGRHQYSNSRERLRVIEGWFKKPVPNALVMRGGQFSGELYDEWSPGHARDLNEGRASLAGRPMEVVHCAIFTDAGLLDLRESPYRHNRYPFTPLWGMRRARDGMPYGIIRSLRDINRDLNKRISKALHHLSTTRVLVEEGAVDDIDVLRDEAARPDAVITYKPGRQPPNVTTDTNIAAAHIEMMRMDANMIQQVGGVTDENMGRRTNATSGIAIERRQDQGMLAVSQFFDNLRQSRSIHGEKVLVLVEQYYTDEQEFRITDARGKPDFVPINDGDPRNAVAAFKADFILSEEDWRASARQAQAEQLLDLAGKLAATAPQIVIGMLDLVVEALDVPKRDELVKRIREITGAADPDEDPENPSEETLAKQEAQAKQAEMADRMAEAEIAEKARPARSQPKPTRPPRRWQATRSRN
jgi:hypothetical protein